jgi:hypothetical protein
VGKNARESSMLPDENYFENYNSTKALNFSDKSVSNNVIQIKPPI